MSSTYRTFIAIKIPASIRHLIKEHIDQLRTSFSDVRASWTREDNLHLTLKFLGNLPVSRIPALSEAVADAAHAIDPFDLIISACGTFPSHGRPKVLWIGAGSAAVLPASSFPLPLALSSLHAALEDGCAAAGFERESRPYRPHLTIARLRDARGSHELSEQHKELGFPPQTFTVSELVVFRSELSSKGSKHTALSRHELG